MKLTPIFAPTLALGALLLLAGCNAQRIVLCPGAAILADTATETVFRAGAPADLSGEAFTASITDIKTDCVFDRTAGQTFSSLDLSFRATRAPTPDAASYSLDYFVTINNAARVLNKKMYTVTFNFAPGGTQAVAQASADQTVIDLERGLLPTDYQMMAGFQLTPGQLDYNRKMGRYVP